MNRHSKKSGRAKVYAPPPDVVVEEKVLDWQARLRLHCRETSQWSLARLLVEGEDLEDEASPGYKKHRSRIYRIAALETGLSVSTLKDLAYTARNIGVELVERFPQLTFAQFREVASPTIDANMKEDLLCEVYGYLEDGRGKGLTVQKTRALVRERTHWKRTKPPPPDGALLIAKAADRLMAKITEHHAVFRFGTVSDRTLVRSKIEALWEVLADAWNCLNDGPLTLQGSMSPWPDFHNGGQRQFPYMAGGWPVINISSDSWSEDYDPCATAYRVGLTKRKQELEQWQQRRQATKSVLQEFYTACGMDLSDTRSAVDAAMEEY